MAGRVARPAQEPDKGNAADEPGRWSLARQRPAEEDAERVSGHKAMSRAKTMIARLMGKGSNLTLRAPKGGTTSAARDARAGAKARSPAERDAKSPPGWRGGRAVGEGVGGGAAPKAHVGGRESPRPTLCAARRGSSTARSDVYDPSQAEGQGEASCIGVSRAGRKPEQAGTKPKRSRARPGAKRGARAA